MHARPTFHGGDSQALQSMVFHDDSHVWDIALKKATEQQRSAARQDSGISCHICRQHVLLDVGTNDVPAICIQCITSAAVPQFKGQLLLFEFRIQRDMVPWV